MKYFLFLFLCTLNIKAYSQDIPIITSEKIESIDINLIGVGMNRFDNLWENQNIKDVELLLAQTLEFANSSYNISWLDDVFIAPSSAIDDKDSSLFQLRLKNLISLNAFIPALRIIGLVPEHFRNEKIAKNHIDILFLNGRNEKACELSQKYLASYKSRYFEEVYNFCMLSQGKETQARIGIELISEKYKDPSLYSKIAENYLFNTNHKIKPALPIDGFSFAIYSYSKIDISNILKQSNDLWTIKLAAKSDIDSAKKAINLGLISYNDITPELKKQILPEKFSLEYYKTQYLEHKEYKLYYLVPTVFKKDLIKLPISEENMKFSDVIIHGLLMIHDYETAFKWYTKADYLANRNEFAKKTAVLFGPIFNFINGYGESNAVVLNKYRLYKNSNDYNKDETEKEFKTLTNLLTNQTTEITDSQLKEMISKNQKGAILFTSLMYATTSPFLINEVNSALKEIYFHDAAKILTIDTILKNFNLGL